MDTNPAQKSRYTVWTGRVITGLVVAFLVLDGAMKLVPIPEVTQAMTHLGFPATNGMARFLGGLLLVCTVLHLVPRTAAIGALLLTGFLGGAIAVQMRVGNPVATHVLFGAYVCVLMWVGLLLRNRDVRTALMPFGKERR